LLMPLATDFRAFVFVPSPQHSNSRQISNDYEEYRTVEVAVARPHAPGALQQAEELLDCLEKLWLTRPVSDTLRPPATVSEWRRNEVTGRPEATDVPGPSPRQSAELQMKHMTDLLVLTFDYLKRTKFCTKYRIASYSCWGDPPESVPVIGMPFVTGCYFERHISRTERRWNRALCSVARKYDLLWFALEKLETYAPGQVFRCGDSRIRILAREPAPLFVRAHRDAMGVLWSIAP
jgi:hypothetical protein